MSEQLNTKLVIGITIAAIAIIIVIVLTQTCLIDTLFGDVDPKPVYESRTINGAAVYGFKIMDGKCATDRVWERLKSADYALLNKIMQSIKDGYIIANPTAAAALLADKNVFTSLTARIVGPNEIYLEGIQTDKSTGGMTLIRVDNYFYKPAK